MRTGSFPWLVLLTATSLWGQGPREQDFKIRVAVEEVRLDAVVLDRKGNQITNLKASDFRILQNGIPQQITSCIYINQTQPRPQKSPGSPKDATLVPQGHAPLLSRENVQRVIVFVLDDIPMSFTDFHWTRLGLGKFIETQMQPGDLVAMVRTSRGMSANQMFSSDRQHLLAMVENFRYGDSTHWDVERLIITGERMAPANSGQEGPGERIEEFFQADADTRIRNLIEAQLWTIRYCIQALQDMPGRKSLLFLSPKLYLPTKLKNDFRRFEPDYDSLYMGAFTRVADEALRAGVVIHMMDIRGLEASADPTVQVARMEERSGSRIPLSKKTGGLFLEDSNFFVTGSGIGRVNEELKGYYLLSYIPPPETFRPDTYNRVKIEAEPRGSQVHTREGFLGMPQTAPLSARLKPSLLNVVFSPFGHKELEVNLASGYFDDPKRGYLLRSWINLDAQKLNVTETEDGNHTVTIEVLCVTSDINDFIQDVVNPRYVFGIRKEDMPWVREHGIRFSLFLPVKKPGAYYVRAAVQDHGSSAVGSAYQFIEIPDLKKNRLCLSNLFILHRGEDGSWIRSGMTEETGSRFSPVLSRDENKSPALRKYRPGESFEYVTVIYNAKFREKLKPDLESQVVLFRNGRETFKTEPEAVNLGDVSDFKRIPIRKRITFGNNMQPGEYLLQLRVKDRQAKGKDSGASQSLSFEIVDPDGR